MKLQLSIRTPTDEQAKEKAERVAAATARKKVATETMEEAWERILAMKNSESDRQRLTEVKQAMADGRIGRAPADAGKRFSKAEALRIWRELNERQRENKIAELVANTPSNYYLVDSEPMIKQLINDIISADIIAVDCETFGEDDGALDPWKGKMAGFSVSTRERHYYVPLNHTEYYGPGFEANVLQALKQPLENAKIVMHNAPFDCKWFYVQYGINLIDSLYADTRIMAMALDENRSHRLKDLISDWLRKPSDNFDELFDKTPFNQIPLNVALPYAAGDTEKTLMLFDWISKWYDKRQDLARIKRLVFEIEMPVARQFIKADLRGICFDTKAARELDEKLAKEEKELHDKITEIFGEEINLNSPLQLKRKLFDDLKLTDIAKGSTGVRVLKKLKKEHDVIPLILEYREVGKLRQAFTQKLPKEVKSDGKIHPWHNTWGAATGRFTCSNPNTQQIPAKRPEVRKLFTSTSNDRILVSIDYSQIELRVLAHLADEKVLQHAFHEGRDIHSTTAALISGYSYEEIEANKDADGSKQQKYRKQAKVVNFGIVYGMGANKLADTLEITKAEAQNIIDDYFKGYPGIASYMDAQHANVKKNGFITDIFGRKRRLQKEVKSRDQYQLYSALRMAGNFPIQSSAGSILKKAIVDLQPLLPELDVFILTQTHDEILFDCPRDIKREDLHAIRDVMAKAAPLKVPVNCDIEIYPERWMDKVDEGEWFNAI